MVAVTTLTSLADLIPSAADRRPDHPALVEPGRTVTWAETDAWAGRVATALGAAGVEAGHRVGVHCRKGIDGFVAMHAVVRIGAVAVPLDPTASPDYLAQVCELAGCRVVLTHPPCAASAGRLAEAAALTAVIAVDQVGDLEPAPAAEVDPESPAYLITTSGSTGTPKCICHTHASALGHIDFALQAYDLDVDDRVADIAPHHFDISTLALWVTPAVAATNVVVPEPHQMLPASAAELAEQEGITVWYSVPYLLAQMHQRGGLDDRDLSSLRWVLFGGEVFPPGILAALMARLPNARFSNVYGPAEVNMCTVHHLDQPPGPDEPVPIGGPVGPVRVRLVDLDDEDGTGPEPPSGTQGEVWVSGPATMAGYWERPDLTASSFTIDDGGRWYHTGDVAWARPDGTLVFAGRRDHQVKVRGHRVELEAIEAVLEDLPGVAYAVATATTDGDGNDVIVAGVRMADGSEPDPAALRSQLSAQLPAYALPRAFQGVHSAPTTGSGKLDRRALRADVVDRFTGGEGI